MRIIKVRFFDMKLTGIGVDIIEIARFDSFKKNKKDVFLRSNYTKNELEYCFSFKSPAPHLAGTFAAKEAVFKALGKEGILFSTIEIRRNKKGRPEVWIKDKIEKKALVSISHTLKIATAVAIKND